MDRFKKALKRLFLAADVPRPAWAMPLEVFFAMLRCLDRSRPRDVVTGAWLFIAFLFALRPEDLAHGRLQWRDIVFLEDGGVDVVVRPGKGKGVRGSTPFSAGPAIDRPAPESPFLAHAHPQFASAEHAGSQTPGVRTSYPRPLLRLADLYQMARPPDQGALCPHVQQAPSGALVCLFSPPRGRNSILQR